MKVLFHYTGYSPSGSGIGGYMKQMGRALRGQGHESFVVTSRTVNLPEEEETDAGVVYRIYDPNETGTETVADKVLAVAKRHGVDLIEGADHLGECAPIIRRKKRPPVLIKIHSCNALNALVASQILYPWQHLTVRAALWRNHSQVKAEELCIRNADIACTPSKRMHTEVIKQGLRTEDRFGVIPNPVDTSNPEKNHEASAPTLLFVGRVDMGKGIHYLPGILERVLREHPNAVLEIAGADSFARGLGALKKWLLLRFSAMAESVRFLGNLNRSELDAAYGRAWVVIVPSRWDNFPGAVLDGMARAKAIVASPFGGMPEMLEGTSCVIEDPSRRIFADRVIAFLSDSRSRSLAGESARQKALKDYSPESVVRRYEAFVRGALK